MPAYFEAGRFTSGDVHWRARRHPVGETEFARDATFGYRASNLRDFVAEKGGEEATSLSLEDIRGGPIASPSASAMARPLGRGERRDYSDLEASCSACRRVGARSSIAPARRSCARWAGSSRGPR